MSDRYEIEKPSRGFPTLVSEVAVLQFDRLVAEVKKWRQSGVSEKAILGEIEQRFRELDEPTRKKIYQLSCDLTPRDDIQVDDVLARKEINDTTCELQIAEPESRLQAGSIIYYQRKRWVLTDLKGQFLTLKQF